MEAAGPAIDTASGNERAGDGNSATQEDTAYLETRSNAARTPERALGGILSIADAAAACRESLTECLAIESLREEWAEDRLADFKLWDAGVGASSNKKASLEERLILKPHVRNVVLDLLIVLKSTFDQCRELGQKADQHANRTDAYSVQVADEFHGTSALLTEAEVTLDSISETLLEAVQTADTLFNDLVRLGVVIRKAAIQSHNLKADKLFRDDHPSLQALRKHLTHVVLFRPRGLEDERNAFWDKPDGSKFLTLPTAKKAEWLKGLNVDSWNFSLAAKELTMVQERLVRANLRRNHRFRYSQRHALKLEQDRYRPSGRADQRSDVHPDTIPEPGNLQGAIKNQSDQPNTDTKTDTNLFPGKESTRENEPPGRLLSDTTASAIDTKFLDNPATSVATSQQSGTAASAIASRIKTQYPRPPRLKENALNFKCPCCCAPLQRKDFTSRHDRWRKHIVGDLHPYTCVLNACVTPYALYTEKTRWVQHMTTDHSHSASYWECSLCDDSVQFGSQDAFNAHLVEDHRGAVTDVPAFAKVCSKPKILHGMGCPLCSRIGDDGDESGEQLLDHVAEHIHTFALSSLPLLYDNDDEDDSKDKLPEKNAYFKDHAYFAESDGNSSLASRGTISEAQVTDRPSSSTKAPSAEGGEESASQGTSAESAHQIKRVGPGQDTDNQLTMSALKDFTVDLRSLEQRVRERHAEIESWSSTMTNEEAAVSSASSEDEDEVAPSQLSLNVDPQDVQAAHSPDPALIGSKDGANDRYDGHKEDDEYHEDSEEFDNEDLSDSLRTEMVQSSFDRLQFLPRGALHRLVTRDSILAAMGINQPNEQDENLTEYIVKNAKAAFAIAVYIRVSRLREALALFEKFGFSDANLPIERWSKDSINDKLNPHPFVSMEGLSVKRNRRIWSWSRIYDFQEEQWKFLAPIISTAESFHDFDESIMPFINKHFDSREGAFSVVSQYEIHPDHFEDPTKSARTRDNNLFAVKAIKAEDRHGSSDHWASEVKALAKMNSLGQDHIVRFITAFRRGKKNSPEHYLVFEWADGGDLVGLWESNPQPILTASLVKAVIKQLLGLAEALDAAHYLKDENGNYSGASYRHGDLKPQNILWFRDSDGIGTLKIGDWGEAKRHNVDTELRYSTTAIYGTRRYEPPEAVIGTHEDVRSRLYDIWSIGCIYFEFLVWFLYGMKELRRFNRSTNEDLSSPSPFFQIDTKGGKRVARVHSITTHWMEQMAQDPACRIGSTALGDLLDIIERGLLVVKLPSRLGSLAFQHRPVLLQPGENDPEQGANTQEFPSINVTPSDSTGISVEPASVPELPARLRAFELRSRLALIMDNVDDDDYWFPDQSRAPNVVIPTQSSTAELFTEPVVPDSVRADYAHPRLEDDWRYEVDNEFASHVLPPPPTFTESDLPLIRVGPPLCGKCIELQNAIWRPGFTITYDTQEISENAKTMTCDLCGLLWRTCTRYSVAASQTVQLDKFCSKLRMNGMRLPVLSIFRSNGTSSLALDVQIGLVDAALALRLDLPRKWAIECDSRHANPTCKPTSNSFDTDHATVPRRLIDVGNPLQMVRLIETAGSSIGIGEWTTIDHMWGPGPQDYVTLSQNYSERTTGMRLDRLPATFRDAIRVTRSLGIQYIWIDSICIVQDDYEDRRENIQHMAAIYTNAYCVLAAGYATSAHSGFLGDRKERDYVTLAPETDFHTAFYICENIDHFEEHVLNSPLSRRAWSLQSHALARRTIFFTEYQMYWQCGHGVRCETMTKMRSNSAAFLGDPDFPKMLKSCSRAEQILRIQSLYRQYSRLKLSNATDRPLAIAGLQQRILRTMDVRGAFGILFSAEKRGILHRSLLWHRASDTSSLERISYFNTETGDVPIPSWSWMAYSGGIDYFNPDFDGYEWQDVRSPWSDNIRSDCLKAFAKDLIGLYFSLEEEHIIHDDPSEADMNGTACLVLGVEKGSTKPSAERRHYVLLVKRDPHNDWSAHAPVWKRIGAGYLPGKCLGHTIGRILVI